MLQNENLVVKIGYDTTENKRGIASSKVVYKGLVNLEKCCKMRICRKKVAKIGSDTAENERGIASSKFVHKGLNLKIAIFAFLIYRPVLSFGTCHRSLLCNVVEEIGIIVT